MHDAAFYRGFHEALRKYAAVDFAHAAELGGLGLLSVPVIHHLLSAKADTTDKVMAGTELAGLGVLAAPSLKHLLHR